MNNQIPLHPVAFTLVVFLLFSRIHISMFANFLLVLIVHLMVPILTTKNIKKDIHNNVAMGGCGEVSL